MGDKAGNPGATSDLCEPQLLQLGTLTPTRRGKKKLNVQSKKEEVVSPEEGSENIKFRLRTPKKLCRDTLSESNVNLLKKQYQAEGASLQSYLIKGADKVADKRDAAVYTVLFDERIRNRSVSLDRVQFQRRVNADSKNVSDSRDATCVNKDLKINSSNNILKLRGTNSDVRCSANNNITEGLVPKSLEVQYKKNNMKEGNSGITSESEEVVSREGATEPKMANFAVNKEVVEKVRSETELLADEISTLSNQLSKLPADSMERMFAELRIDMKKDSLKILKRFDKVEVSTDVLAADVKKLNEGKLEVDKALEDIVSTQVEEKNRVDTANTKIDALKDEIRILSGIVQRQSQVKSLEDNQDLQRQLNNTRGNLLISGLDEEEDGEAETTTAEMVADFFSQTMKMPKATPIISAIRIGQAKPKTVLVKLKDPNDKLEIFKYTKNLKEVRNSKDGEIYVNSQLPPQLQEKKKWFRYLMKHNAGMSEVGKRRMKIKKGVLYIDDREFRPAVVPPNTGEVVHPLDMRHVDRIKLSRGEDIKKGGCTFIGYSVAISNIADVRAAYTKVRRLHSRALSISCGYRLPGLDFPTLRGCADDNEHGAGWVLYMMLESAKIFHRAFFVVRYFGNKHLGPIRFQLIRDAMNSALGRSSFNDVTNEHQFMSREGDEEVSFKKPTGNAPGYARVASPRPFPTQTSNWGSMDSVSSLTQGKDCWEDQDELPRQRSGSVGSSASYQSVLSDGSGLKNR